MYNELEEKKVVDLAVTTWHEPHFWQDWETEGRPKAEFMGYFANTMYTDTTAYAFARVKRYDLMVEWKSKDLRISRAAKLAEWLGLRLGRYYHLTDEALLDRLIRHPRLSMDWRFVYQPEGETCPECSMRGKGHSVVTTPYGDAHQVSLDTKTEKGLYGHDVYFQGVYRYNISYKEARDFVLSKVRKAHQASLVVAS